MQEVFFMRCVWALLVGWSLGACGGQSNAPPAGSGVTDDGGQRGDGEVAQDGAPADSAAVQDVAAADDGGDACVAEDPCVRDGGIGSPWRCGIGVPDTCGNLHQCMCPGGYECSGGSDGTCQAVNPCGAGMYKCADGGCSPTPC